ncbi:MAG: hypothetical protein JRJ51_24000 [Deltaproteobacteria bacterium]|nr:hypothetical protein [Deltaproteobacteria bacterium]
MIGLIRQLTHVNKGQLKEYLPEISDEGIKRRIKNILKISKKAPLTLLNSLADLVVESRETVAAKEIRPQEATVLINLNVSANLLMHITVTRLMELSREWSAKELLSILKDLVGGSYGAGLMSHREYESAKSSLDRLLTAPDLTIGQAYRILNRTRVVEWAQASIVTS